MAILPISQELCLCVPFCDYANISTPKEHSEAIKALLLPFLDVIGALQAFEGLFLLPNKGGAFKIYEKGLVSVYSFSGGILERLRHSKMLDDVLFVFADFPHNVSMLHATVDYGISAPKILNRIYNDANNGLIQLSRKALSRKNIHKYFVMNEHGDDTGTLYLGDKAKSDIWAKVYDKQQERIDAGHEDPGSMLRVEMAFQTDVGATLKDIQNPHDLFYQYAGKSLVKKPKGFKGWVSYALPFKIERKELDLTTWQRIWGIVENSTDIGRILDLAEADYGADAEQEIMKIIRKRMRLRLGRNPH